MGRASNRKEVSRQQRSESQTGGAIPAAVQLTKFSSQQVSSYHSFHPPAAELEVLEQYCEGITERYMALGEGEALHRRAMQSRQLWFNGVTAVLGLLIGGAIGLLAVGGGVYAMVQHGATLGNSATAIGGLAALVGVFIVGRRQ